MKKILSTLICIAFLSLSLSHLHIHSVSSDEPNYNFGYIEEGTITTNIESRIVGTWGEASGGNGYADSISAYFRAVDGYGAYSGRVTAGLYVYVDSTTSFAGDIIGQTEVLDIYLPEDTTQWLTFEFQGDRPAIQNGVRYYCIISAEERVGNLKVMSTSSSGYGFYKSVTYDDTLPSTLDGELPSGYRRSIYCTYSGEAGGATTTFGNTEEGTSTTNLENRIVGTWGEASGGNGYADSISAYLRAVDGFGDYTGRVTAGLYEYIDSSSSYAGAKIAQTEVREIFITDGSTQWITFNFQGDRPAIQDGTRYYCILSADVGPGSLQLMANIESGYSVYLIEYYEDILPSTFGGEYPSSYRRSIYCTYSSEGGGTSSTFGNTEEGTSTTNLENRIVGTWGEASEGNGYADSISALVYAVQGNGDYTGRMTAGLYEYIDSSSALAGDIIGQAEAKDIYIPDGSTQWITFNFQGDRPAIQSGVRYYCVVSAEIGPGSLQLMATIESSYSMYMIEFYSDTLPLSLSGEISSGYHRNIYCTYTSEGSGFTDVFGCTEEGISTTNLENRIVGTWGEASGGNGYADSISAYLRAVDGFGDYTGRVTAGLYEYLDSSSSFAGAKIGQTEVFDVYLPEGTTEWITFNFLGEKPAIENEQRYYLILSAEDGPGTLQLMANADTSGYSMYMIEYFSDTLPGTLEGEYLSNYQRNIYCTYSGGSGGPPPTRSKIQKLSICYSTSINEPENQQFIAEHFDMLDCGKSVYGAALNIKVLNPDIEIIGYYDAIIMPSYYGDWDYVNQFEEWFVHDIYYQRVKLYGSDRYLMNPTLYTTPGEEYTSWSDYYAQKSAQFLLDNSHYNGIFVDDCAYNLEDTGYQWTVPYDQFEYGIIDNWPNFMMDHIENLQNAIGSDMVMPNAWKYTEFCEEITGVHLWENFVHGKIHDITQTGYNPWYTLYAVDKLKDMAELGYSIAAISGTKNADSNPDLAHQYMLFTMICFLFAVEDMDKSYFGWNFFEDDASNGYYPEMDYEFGDPLGDYYHIQDEVYARQFQYATVVANIDTAQTENVYIGGQWYELEPRSGLII